MLTALGIDQRSMEKTTTQQTILSLEAELKLASAVKEIFYTKLYKAMTHAQLIEKLNEVDKKDLKTLLLKLVTPTDPTASRPGYFVLTSSPTKKFFTSHSISGGIFTYTKSNGRTHKIAWSKVDRISLQP